MNEDTMRSPQSETPPLAPERSTGASVGNLSVGVDLVEVRRIAMIAERYGVRFGRRVFTERELADCGLRAESLAARWAAKEAVAKALGTGFGPVGYLEIEVVQGEAGCPHVHLHGRAAALAEARGLARWALSIAHDGGMAIAFVVAI
jgi:holo-[acyl-carrier protein] synthase